MNLLNSKSAKIMPQSHTLKTLFKDRYMYFGLIIIVFLSFFVFFNTFYIENWQSLNLHEVSDVPTHVLSINRFHSLHHFPVYSLWFILVYLTSGFSENYNTLASIAIFYLVFFVTVKYMITYSILSSQQTKAILTLFAATTLAIVMPIISYYGSAQPSNIFATNNLHIYLGNIAPNQWHNSTLILAMPFNLCLFYFSVKNVDSNKLRDFLIMSGLNILSILCKPNYAMAFLPIFCSYVLLLNYKNKRLFTGFLKVGLIAIPAILVLLFQWYFTFKYNGSLAYTTKTIIDPFLVWKLYSPHIFISLMLSITFPLIIVIFYFKKIDLYLFMSWLIFIFALITFSLLAEYPIYSAANYEWGVIAANYILFLFSIRLLLIQPVDWKAKTAFLLFFLHIVSGIILLSCFFVYQTSLRL